MNRLNFWMLTSASFWFILFSYSLLLTSRSTGAVMCYTCRGTCYRNSRCNCYTGMCEGDYCYSSGEYSGDGSIIVEKGCIRRPTLTTMGCEYQRQPSQVLCICNATNFCNENTLVGGKSSSHVSVSCYDCRHGAHSCPHRCRGDYCIIDTAHRQQSCGYGLPVLPFHHQTNELLPPLYDDNDVSASCVTVRYADDQENTMCACNGSQCNTVSVATEDPWLTMNKRYVTCYRCQTITDGFTLSLCTNGTCIGEYCILKVRNYSRPKPSYVHTAGCMNSTSSTLVIRGCTHRWVLDVKEEIDCACDTNFCNADLSSANVSSSAGLVTVGLSKLLLLIGIVALTLLCEGRVATI